ncbi:MAG: lysophospholipid acyltransferase family protein [Deltaproteobacteria bacterium]|nr:lysophospholipid acyltransferase family protein [Deltaproteobacteria bacterium]
MGYWIIRTIFQIMACIPLGLGRFLGKTLGIFISLLPFKRLKVSLDNIQNTLGGSLTGPEASRLNRRVYMHFGQALFELSRIFRMNNKNLDKYIVLEGEDNLTKALAKGKGVFLLSAHIGNWEMITAAVSIRYGRLSAIASTQHSPAVDRLIKTIRTRFGMEVIPKKQGLKMMISAVKRNRIVGILLDLNSKWDQGVFVDFLGRPACTNKSLAVMVLKMDTPVIPAFSIREKDGLYHIYLGEEIKPIRTGDRTMDIEENTALFTRIIEAQVRKNPDQWLWVHRRWKTLPYCPLH